MFVTFFHELKSAGVPVTLREYLTLMEAMEKDLASRRVEAFYSLSRAALVKDERNLDKFDRVFGHVFKGLEFISEAGAAKIPAEWLKKLTEKYLTEEEKKEIEALGGLDKLLETLRERLKEQKGRHQGGSKWIGTGGTSPFGAYGYNPEGIRIGQEGNRNFRAVKVWDKREFRDLDGEFKHMEHFYFHNCLYERVWKENRRRFDQTTPTFDVMHTYPHDYKAIFVGDASMSLYEIVMPGGSVEHMNPEPGQTWMERMTRTYPACVWLNPVPESQWEYTQSIRAMYQLMGGRMYPLTLEGLDKAMRELVR
jgi:uncharacterized protein with von Willebrand factor type A (vWA) domain